MMRKNRDKKMWQVFHVRLRFYILPLIFLMITVYFTFHLIKGERGLFRLFTLNQELKQASAMLSETNLEKELMENKVRSLSSEALDTGMLDEVVRKELSVIKKEEYVIFN